MNEWLVVPGIGLAAISGLPGLVLGRATAAGERLAAGCVVAGALTAGTGALRALIAPGTAAPIRIAWQVPLGALHIEVDALSAMFELQVFVLAALGAIYALAYWRQADHPDNGRKLLVPSVERVDEQRRWVIWMQRGSAHAYLLYILATLVVLLIWKGGG